MSTAISLLNIDEQKIEELNKKKLSITQEQTQQAFAYEWSQQEAYESEEHAEVRRKWMFEKYCNNDPSKLKEWLAGGKKIILDAGCGSGYAALIFWGELLKNNYYLGVDISDAVEIGKEKFNNAGIPGDFIKVDLLDLPIEDKSVDIIFSEGVLHHTDSTEDSIKYLSKKLKSGGRFMFYVYAKKAVIREFCDDHIRKAIQPLSDKDAWETLRPLTKLGKAIGDLNIDIEVPEDIPYLGIKKGSINLQRFFYWNLFKAFYRPEFSIEEMNLINFDWYRPLNCHRHTKEEIKSYCKNSGLNIEYLNEQEAGFTVIAIKQ